MNKFLFKKKKCLLNTYQIFYFIFYFLRYFPLIVLTHDWFLFDTHGYYYYFSKLSFVEFLKAIEINSNFLDITIIFSTLLMIILNIYFLRDYLQLNDTKTQKKNKLPPMIKYITITFFCILFYFSNFPFEVIFYSIFGKICKESNPIFFVYSDNFFKHVISSCTSFSLFSLIINIVFLINLVFIHYFFDLFFLSFYHIQELEFNGNLNGIMLKNLILPFMNIFIFFEKLFFMNKHLLCIKLFIRVIFLIQLIIKLKRIFSDVINKYILSIELFCMFSVFFDFMSFLECFKISSLYSKDASYLNILKKFQSDPGAISEFYQKKYLIVKFMFQLVLTLICLNYLQKKDISISSDIFRIKKAFYVSSKNIGQINRFIYQIYNFDKFDNNFQLSFLCSFIENVYTHFKTCQIKGCDCKEILENIILIISNNNEHTRIQTIKSFLIEYAGKTIDNFPKKNIGKETNNQTHLLLIRIINNLFLKKNFLSAYYDLQKLVSCKIIIKNKAALIKLETLKHEIKSNYFMENKSKAYNSFVNIINDFKTFRIFSELFDENKKVVKIFKEINVNFSKNERNRKMKIREYFSFKNFYDFDDISNDFNSLSVNLKNYKSVFSKIDKENSDEYKVDLNCISLIHKFFYGNENIKSFSSLDLDKNASLFSSSSQFQNVFQMKSFTYENLISKKTVKIILKQNKQGNIIYSKIPIKFANDLDFRISEIIGKSIDFLMPVAFIENHQNRVFSYLYQNKSLISNKEIYFISKNGYCKNYTINGTVLLTLDHELIIFADLNKLTINKDICFFTIDTLGEIIAFDENIKDNLFIDNLFMKCVKPNFFKNFFDLQSLIEKYKNKSLNQIKDGPLLLKQNEKVYKFDIKKNITDVDLDFFQKNVNKKIESTIDYLGLINKLRKSNFNKIFECIYSNEFSKEKIDAKKLNYLEKLDQVTQLLRNESKRKIIDNNDKFICQTTEVNLRKVSLKIKIRTLNNFYFYEIELDFSKILELKKLKNNDVPKFFSNNLFDQRIINRNDSSRMIDERTSKDEKLDCWKENFNNKSGIEKRNSRLLKEKTIFNKCDLIKEDEIEMYYGVKNEKKFLENIIKLVNYMTKNFYEDKETLEVNMNTVQVFLDSYLNNTGGITRKYIDKNFSDFIINNKLDEFKNSTNEYLDVNIKNNLLFKIWFFIILILSYVLINSYNIDTFKNIFLLTDFSQYSFTLKSYYSVISSSILSIYLVKKGIEEDIFVFNIENELVRYNNTFKYQIDRIKTRSNLYMNKFYFFRNIYLQSSSLVLSQNNVLTEEIENQLLSTNWQNYKEKISFFENLNLLHLYSNEIKEKDVENLSLDVLFGEIKNKDNSPNKADFYIYMYLKNTVDPIMTSFQRLILDNSNILDSYIENARSIAFYFYLFSCISFLSIQVIQIFYIHKKYSLIILKLTILTNYMRLFSEPILKKIDFVIEIVNDLKINNFNDKNDLDKIKSENLNNVIIQFSSNKKNLDDYQNDLNHNLSIGRNDSYFYKNENNEFAKFENSPSKIKNINSKYIKQNSESIKHKNILSPESKQEKLSNSNQNLFDTSNNTSFYIETIDELEGWEIIDIKNKNIGKENEISFMKKFSLNDGNSEKRNFNLGPPIKKKNDLYISINGNFKDNQKDYDLSSISIYEDITKQKQLENYQVKRSLRLNLNNRLINKEAEEKRNYFKNTESYRKTLNVDDYLSALKFDGLNDNSNLKIKKLSPGKNIIYSAKIFKNSKQSSVLNKNLIKQDLSDSAVNLNTNSISINSNFNKKCNNNDNFLSLKLNNKKNKNLEKPSITSIISNLKFLKQSPLSKGILKTRKTSIKDIPNQNKTQQFTINSDLTECGLINNSTVVLENEENIFHIKYNTPRKYISYTKILIFIFLGSLLLSIIILILIDNNYTSVKEFYVIKNAFVTRNSILFDSLFYLKITIMNRNMLVLDIYKNSTYMNIFQKSIETLDKSIKIIKQYENKNKLEKDNFNCIKFFEESLQSKYFCEYYTYFSNKEYLDKITENIDQIPSITVDHLEHLKKNDTQFYNEFRNCQKKSGNLFNSGFYEFLNAAKYILINSMSDFENYERNKKTFDKNEYIELIKGYFRAETIIKLNYGLKNIIDNLSEVYLKLLDKSEIQFRDHLYRMVKISNFCLMSLFLLVMIINVIILVDLIYKPNMIVDTAFNIIKNAIFFKIV